jgi:L-threonylcarbamoyladenylate synthase
VLLKANDRNIKIAAKLIAEGDVVAFPTETVYGLGADALNPKSVARIFEIKKRPTFNPLIVHIAHKESIKDYSQKHDSRIIELIENFWPGPLTLVLKKKKIIPDIVTAGNDTVALRMPNHKVALKLIEYSERPIAAPSANSFGFLSPTDPLHVEKQLGNKIKIILDGGTTSIGVESTIISFADKTPVLLRPGGLPLEKIEEVIGRVNFGAEYSDKPVSPGQLKFHYAPKIPIDFLNETTIEKYSDKKIGVLFFKEKSFDNIFAVEKFLSKSGSLNEAAVNFFRHLHELECKDIDVILCEKLPRKGLGFAIMDRLQKAVNKYV